ncbi:MAG: cystathionine beta-lyase [Rhizobiales bacterium]|nr:cystathionine beta-lyase [Hyphomicrobiales bacterium]
MSEKKTDTVIISAGRDPEANFGIVNPPVYHASTVLYPDMATLRAKKRPLVTYGRRGTPTTFALQDAIAELEGGYKTVLTASGLAGCTIALLAHLHAGDHVLITDSVYGPTRNFADKVLKRYGVEVEYYDPLIGNGIAALLRPNTKVLFVEAPGSNTFEVQDIPAMAEIAHAAGALVMMDNTWASPLYFKPFEHGVDVSIQAVTKYICGHSDVMMGSITTTEAAYKATLDMHGDIGMAVAPDDVYLAMRGLRTLSVRLARHMETGLTLAKWFEDRPEVARVIHPALPTDPGHEIWKRDFTGASGLFSIVLKTHAQDAVAAFVDHLELFGIGYSWGGFESLVMPQNPGDYRTATKWEAEGQLIRFHAGLEDVGDLIADLEAAFANMKTVTG